MLNTKKGVSIYLAIIIMAALLAIVLGLNAILISQIKIIRNMGYSVVAFYAAEAGIEGALKIENATSSSLANGASYVVTKLSPGTGVCLATANNYCLVSIGNYQGTRRAIQVSR
jgi:hypothetical protein